MDRRALLVTGGAFLVSSTTAGCLDGEPDDAEEDVYPESSNYRDVIIDHPSLLRRADSLVIESGKAFLTLRLVNVGTDPAYAEISVQMRDPDSEPIGSPYSRSYGPIEPDESVLIRFDIEQRPEDVAGYEIVVSEPEDDS